MAFRWIWIWVRIWVWVRRKDLKLFLGGRGLGRDARFTLELDHDFRGLEAGRSQEMQLIQGLF